MYGLYGRNGILRFVNSDKEACLDYAELFELNSSHFCLMNLVMEGYLILVREKETFVEFGVG